MTIETLIELIKTFSDEECAEALEYIKEKR